ncbi:hypothetical protein [Methylobacter svalbardensis]|uniref:hypothetical protein n=1 Tax=Methylobacter svalbardensis TaxID=3080016 RepID=UPI0030EE4903
MPNAIIGWLWLDALVFGRAQYLTREVLGYAIAITELPTLLRIAGATAMRSSVGQETFLIMAEITKKETKKKSTNVYHATNTTKRAGCCRKAYIKPSASIEIISDLAWCFIVIAMNPALPPDGSPVRR